MRPNDRRAGSGGTAAVLSRPERRWARLLLLPFVLLLPWASFGCCEARARRGCESSAGCREHGVCGIRTFLTGDGLSVCVVDSEAACARSSDCATKGLCHLDYGLTPTNCVAKTAADCLKSAGCATDGRCTLGDAGVCVTSSAGCSRSPTMRAQHRTRPSEQPLLGVRRPSPHRYRPSDDDGTCLAGAPGCAAACREEGACTDTAGECLASSDADCRASVVCARNGRCAVDPVTHTCVARNVADCAAADVCVRGGRDPISNLDTRTCGARPDVDMCTSPLCARSEECALRGNCGAVGGICVPTEPAHCTASVDCRVRGICSYRPYSCFGDTQPDCDASMECRAYGRCKYAREQLSRVGYCQDPAIGTEYSHCLDDTCWTDDACLRTKTGTCVTPASAGQPPLRPPEPPVAQRMLAGLDDRSFSITHALARPGKTEGAVELRLSARPFDCSVFDNPGSPTSRLEVEVHAPKPGYVLVASAVHLVQWATTPAITTNDAARFAAAATLGHAPTPIGIDLDTNALPNRTLSLHGDLVAQPCPSSAR